MDAEETEWEADLVRGGEAPVTNMVSDMMCYKPWHEIPATATRQEQPHETMMVMHDFAVEDSMMMLPHKMHSDSAEDEVMHYLDASPAFGHDDDYMQDVAQDFSAVGF